MGVVVTKNVLTRYIYNFTMPVTSNHCDVIMATHAHKSENGFTRHHLSAYFCDVQLLLLSQVFREFNCNCSETLFKHPDFV